MKENAPACFDHLAHFHHADLLWKEETWCARVNGSHFQPTASVVQALTNVLTSHIQVVSSVVVGSSSKVNLREWDKGICPQRLPDPQLLVQDDASWEGDHCSCELCHYVLLQAPCLNKTIFSSAGFASTVGKKKKKKGWGSSFLHSHSHANRMVWQDRSCHPVTEKASRLKWSCQGCELCWKGTHARGYHKPRQTLMWTHFLNIHLLGWLLSQHIRHFLW